MTIVVTLVLIGLIFIAFETIVPGGLLAFLGLNALLGALLYSYMQYGLTNTIGIFMLNLLLFMAFVIPTLKFLSKTKAGQCIFLKKTIESKSTKIQGDGDLIGKIGEALTTLAPTGTIRVENEEYEGFSQDHLIPKGTPIIVFKRENFRIIVRKHKP